MNHPNRETWMSYLYDELSGSERKQAAAHLAECPECQAQVAAWRATTSALNAWKLPRRREGRPVFLQPVFQWAAAAVVVLSVGFGVGRLTAPAANVEQVRAALEPSLRRQLQAEFLQTVRTELAQASARTLEASREETKQWLAGFASQVEQTRDEDRQAVRTALAALRQEQLTDRRDLETVAVLTGAGLRQTQQQLVQLASYPVATPTTP
jgi:anti-sigma factor RsiW